MNRNIHQDLANYRIAKARETLNEVSMHVENELWNTAINRLYYACYYAVIALLIKNNIKSHSHAGVRQMFGLHFVKNEIIDKDLAKFFSDIFDLRQSSDYEDYVDFTKEDVSDLLPRAHAFVSDIEKLLNQIK